MTSSGLSDGTLRILALTLLPFLGEEVMPGLLVTEEPENGIHPRAIETVVQSLGSLYDSQVWVSTQSPQVLAHTDLSDVLVARIEGDGSVSVVPGPLCASTCVLGFLDQLDHCLRSRAPSMYQSWRWSAVDVPLMGLRVGGGAEVSVTY